MTKQPARRMMNQSNKEPAKDNAARQGPIFSFLHHLINSSLVLVLVIFALALGPRLSDLGVFVGPDEFSWVTRATEFTRALAQGDLGKTYQTGHPGVTLMWVETLNTWLRGSTNAVNDADKTMVVLAEKRQAVAVVNALLVAVSALSIYRFIRRSCFIQG